MELFRLEGGWVTALAETPRGLYVGTGDNRVYRCSPESGKWEALGLDHAAVGAMLFVRGIRYRGPRPDVAALGWWAGCAI